MQNFDSGINSIEKLFTYFPDFESFNLSSIILKSDLSAVEKQIANNNDALEILLLDRLKYAESTDSRHSLFIKLTPLGRQVKQAGGHFAYLKSLADKAAADTERQEQKDKSDKLDFVKKRWEYKNRRLPYIISTLALIGTIFSIFINYYNMSLKKRQDQSNLQSMQEQIQKLKDKVNKMDSLFLMDTLQRKRN